MLNQLKSNIKNYIMEVIKMELLENLESHRLKNRTSQEEIAKKIGVSFSTVNRWLNNKSRPNKIHQYHIKEFLRSEVNQDECCTIR